jgi:hypothetical protein
MADPVLPPVCATCRLFRWLAISSLIAAVLTGWITHHG